MEGLKAFFMILIFGHSVLLTPEGVNLQNTWSDVPIKEPISAITPGAALFLDVTRPANNERDYEKLKIAFPRGLVEAKLMTKEGKEIKLIYMDGIAFQKGAISLILHPKNLPLKTDFTRLLIRSERPLEDVLLTWQNYSE